jgi:ferritin-like metal-binding protein YciE
VYTQWADKFITAGEHYLEVAEDLSNLKSVLEYCRANDAKCAEIAANGKRVADQLRTESALSAGLIEAIQQVYA